MHAEGRSLPQLLTQLHASHYSSLHASLSPQAPNYPITQPEGEGPAPNPPPSQEQRVPRSPLSDSPGGSCRLAGSWMVAAGGPLGATAGRGAPPAATRSTAAGGGAEGALDEEEMEEEEEEAVEEAAACSGWPAGSSPAGAAAGALMEEEEAAMGDGRAGAAARRAARRRPAASLRRCPGSGHTWPARSPRRSPLLAAAHTWARPPLPAARGREEKGRERKAGGGRAGAAQLALLRRRPAPPPRGALWLGVGVTLGCWRGWGRAPSTCCEVVVGWGLAAPLG